MAKIGIYHYNMQARGGGERKTAVMAEYFSHQHEVILIVYHPVDLLEIGKYFQIDLSRVQLLTLSDIGRSSRKEIQPHGSSRVINRTQSILRYLRLKALRLDLFINNSPEDTLPCPARHGIYMCMFPKKQDEPPATGPQKWLRRVGHWTGGSVEDRIRTYSVVTANSHFTSDWITHWWHCPSEVIYSVPEDMGPPARKEQIILHVGRFSGTGGENHPKRQETMLAVFKEMTDFHAAGWTLHFAGSAGSTPEDAQFLGPLQEAAVGYPIEFHFNATRDALRDLYRRAAIYWHATGYGFPAETYPKQQEHLGLAPLEAMSAGAIPIVINSGGLRETVDHGRTGFHWDTLEELQDFTRQVAHDPNLQERMRQEAMRSLKPFRMDMFLARMDRIVARLLNTAPTHSE